MTALAIIPARGGSKGIRHKNTALCAGKPLVQWTVEAATQAKSVDHVVLCSDDPVILSHHDSAMPCDRPQRLAEDTSRTEDVVFHVLEAWGGKLRPTVMVVLQPTSPQRTAQQVDDALTLLQVGGFDTVLGVVPSHAFLWQPNGIRGFPHGWARRQDLIPYYEENGAVYVCTIDHWEKTGSFRGGKQSLYVMPEETRIQVDTPYDLYLAEKTLEWMARHENR